MRMLDHFVHDGPNGRHQCIVGEVLGPTLSSYIYLFYDSNGFPGNMARGLAGQIALGVQYLHKRCVVHGDLHRGNVLLCPPPAAWSSSTDIKTYLGRLHKCCLRAQTPGPHVPQLSQRPLVAEARTFRRIWCPPPPATLSSSSS